MNIFAMLGGLSGIEQVVLLIMALCTAVLGILITALIIAIWQHRKEFPNGHQ